MLFHFSLRVSCGLVLFRFSRLPSEVAAQIVPVAHVPTARRQAAAGRTPQVRRPPRLHEVINANKILGFTGEADGRPYLRISRAENDGDASATENELELLSDTPVEVSDEEKAGEPLRTETRFEVEEDDISDSWDLLNMGVITPMNFIDRVKFKIDGGESKFYIAFDFRSPIHTSHEETS